MRSRIIATDEALLEPPSSLAEQEAIWRERAAARGEFLAALGALEPPEEVIDLHATAEGILDRLADAEAAIGDQIGRYEDLAQLDGLGSTPAFQAFLAVNEEATGICLAAQGVFDDTEMGKSLTGMPWIPTEMTEVIQVAFGCVPDEP